MTRKRTRYSRKVDDFRQWTAGLTLDSGKPFDLEGFQLEVIRDYTAGVPVIWLVVPEGNGKTTLMAAIAVHHALHTPMASVPIGAATREQAEIVYQQAAGFIQRDPELRAQFKRMDGYRRLKCLETGGIIQVYAAAVDSADGVIPSLALLDELHRHKDLRLYELWAGKLNKRGGQLIAISTAGEPGSEFEDRREALRKQATDLRPEGPYVRAATDRVVLHDWAIRDPEQVADLDAVAEANPLKRITARSLEAEFSSPTMTLEHWGRFKANIPTRIDGAGVQPGEWDALYEEDLTPDKDAWCVAWLDLGWKVDTTAMGVLVWEDDDRRVITGARILTPPVQESDVVDGLLDLQRDFPNLEGVVFDPNAGGQQMAQLLERGSHPLQALYGTPPLEFFEHSQDNAPMALAAARFDEAVRSGWIRHDGDRDLRAHVLNASRKPLGGEKWKYVRPSGAEGRRRAQYPIDALTGVLMGHSYAVGTHEAAGVPLIVVGDPQRARSVNPSHRTAILESERSHQ